MLKFFADEGFPRNSTERLRLLGWNISELTVDAPHLCGTDDVDYVLAHAKRTRRILLTGDMYEDRETRIKIRRNIRRTKRGRVMCVAGASDSDWTKTVGKLLFHQEEWEDFFAGGHGIVRIGDLKPNSLSKQRPEDIELVSHAAIRQGERYIRRPKQLRLKKARFPNGPDTT